MSATLTYTDVLAYLARLEAVEEASTILRGQLEKAGILPEA